MKKRQLAILGSTGSIGTQALEVVSEHSDLFEVYALTANNQVDLLINQARKYMPEVVVIANERKYPELKEALEDLPIKVWAGADAIAQMVQSEPWAIPACDRRSRRSRRERRSPWRIRKLWSWPAS